MDRALLIGINAYPSGCGLRGCLDDIEDIKSTLLAGWDPNNIMSLLDNEADTANMKDAMKRLADPSVEPGRRFFWYSGHGCTIPDPKRLEGYICAICPVDFSWDWIHQVTGQDFHDIFLVMRPECTLTMGSDSCHSGHLDFLRDKSMGMQMAWHGGLPTFIPRSYPIPVEVSIPKTAIPKSMHKDMPNHFSWSYISGCKDDETSADACIAGRFNGAMTYALLHAYHLNAHRDLIELSQDAHGWLNANGYSQHPQADGDMVNTKPWFVPIPPVV